MGGMRWTEIASIAAGIVIGTFGWIIIAGSMLSIGDSGEEPVPHLVLTVLLGVVPAGLGIAMILRPFRLRGRRRKEERERAILELAEVSDGVLTPSHLARSTDLTLDEAKATLDDLALRGHCTFDLRDDGQTAYRF